MTDWKSQLRRASFRGVPFGVFAANTSGGRRVVSHEYPQKDVPFVEDLGRKGKIYNIEAFVVGSDYMQQRQALEAALDAKGPGKLVHPYLGELSLQVADYSYMESRDDGGMAEFQITFWQTTANPIYPTTTNNSAGQTQTKAVTVNTAAQTTTAKVYSVSGQNQATVSANAQAVASDSVTLVGNGMKSGIATLTDQLDSFTRDLAQLSVDVQSLVTDPAQMIFRFQSILSRLTVALDPFKALSVYRRIFDSVTGYFGGKAYGSSSSAVQIHSNDSALNQALQVSILSNMAYLAVMVDFQTRRQAEDTRNMLDALIESIIYGITDDDLYSEIVELRGLINASIPAEGAALKDEVSVPVLSPVPSLVLAYQIFGDVSNELDIVARNDVPNPFCVPAGDIVVIR